jgi:DNA-binding CsgD family transcriptional regulator
MSSGEIAMLLCLDKLEPNCSVDLPLHPARSALLSALDMEQLWHACVAFIEAVLPCHSCSLMFDIEGFQPQRGHHHQAQPLPDASPPVTSLDVAAPYLHEHPRVRCYTFSQIALHDAQAQARLRAQQPAPGWHEFIHLAFWEDDTLDAVLSLRLPDASTCLGAAEQSRLTELYIMLEAGLQRIRALARLRARQQACEALLAHLSEAAMVIDTHARPLHLKHRARVFCRAGESHSQSTPRLSPALECALTRWISNSRLHRHAPAPQELTVDDPLHGRLRLQITAHPASTSPAAFLVSVIDASQTALTAVSAQADAQRQDQALQRLSPSERRVAMLVAQGMRNAEIAKRLCRSNKTIETQVSAVFRKLDLANRSQLVRMMM